MTQLESMINTLVMERDVIQKQIIDNEFQLDQCESDKECRNLKGIQSQRYLLIKRLHGIEREVKNIFVSGLFVLADQLMTRYPDIEISNIYQGSRDIGLRIKMKPKKVLGVINKPSNFNSERFYELKRNLLKIHSKCYVTGELTDVDKVSVVININVLEDEGHIPAEVMALQAYPEKYLT